MVVVRVIAPILYSTGRWEGRRRRIGRGCYREVVRCDIETAICVNGSIDDERRARLNLEIVYVKDRVRPRKVEFLLKDAPDFRGNVAGQGGDLYIRGSEV